MMTSNVLQTISPNELERKVKTIYKKVAVHPESKYHFEMGKKLAEHLFEWSKTDGGHRGYLKNFDPDYEREPFPGSWKPPLFAQSFSHNPLHHFWGENRTFAPTNTLLELPEFIPYDPAKGSPYYQEFEAVYYRTRLKFQSNQVILHEFLIGQDP